MNVRNPRTGEFDYEITPLTNEELKDKVLDLRDSQEIWANQSLSIRINAIKAWKETLQEHRDALIQALITDTGRKLETIFEVDFFLQSIDEWCNLAKDFFVEHPRVKITISSIEKKNQFVPYQLISVISPSTFPLFFSIFDTIPALLSGCAVIVKPSELTPRFAEVLVNTLSENPQIEEVLCFINGGHTTSVELTNLCDKVCFTGSSESAKDILKIASENLTPVLLETGSRNIAIVSESAEIERATSAILWGSAFNAGQSCNSIESIYVHRNIYHQFLSRLVGKANLLEFNYPNINTGELGPIISEKQVGKINELLADAISKGAVIKAGDKACSVVVGGYYCRPTVMININDSMKLLKEEHLAPLLPVITYFNLDEIAQLDSLNYNGSVVIFAESEEEALQIAEKINVKTISINNVGINSLLPEITIERFERFVRTKTLLIDNQATKSDWWY